MKNEPLKALNVMVPMSMHDKIRQLAFDQDRTKADLIREILKEGLK